MKLSHHLAGALSLLAASSSFAALWTSGHGDLGFEYDAATDDWEPHWHLGEDEPAIVDGMSIIDEEREIDEITVRVLGPPQPGAGIPDSGADLVYNLPQGESAASALGNPFVGIAAEEIGAGIFLGEELTLTLVSVSGPGVFSLWETGPLGGTTTLMSSAMGASVPNSIIVPVGDHAHFNLGFSEVGIYDVTYRIEGDLVAGGATTGTSFTAQYRAVPEPAAVSLVLLGALGLLRRRRS